jgi:hypothetical protein
LKVKRRIAITDNRVMAALNWWSITANPREAIFFFIFKKRRRQNTENNPVNIKKRMIVSSLSKLGSSGD